MSGLFTLSTSLLSVSFRGKLQKVNSGHTSPGAHLISVTAVWFKHESDFTEDADSQAGHACSRFDCGHGHGDGHGHGQDNLLRYLSYRKAPPFPLTAAVSAPGACQVRAPLHAIFGSVTQASGALLARNRVRRNPRFGSPINGAPS